MNGSTFNVGDSWYISVGPVTPSMKVFANGVLMGVTDSGGWLDIGGKFGVGDVGTHSVNWVIGEGPNAINYATMNYVVNGPVISQTQQTMWFSPTVTGNQTSSTDAQQSLPTTMVLNTTNSNAVNTPVSGAPVDPNLSDVVVGGVDLSLLGNNTIAGIPIWMLGVGVLAVGYMMMNGGSHRR